MNQLTGHAPRTNVLPELARRHSESSSILSARTGPKSGWMARFMRKAHAEGVFPADEVRWGIAIRRGHDEIDDPWYHRGTPGHAYLAGNDRVALCGYRPRRYLTGRPVKLGLPPDVTHPKCARCARHVVAPRCRIAIPIEPSYAVIPVSAPAEPARPLWDVLKAPARA